MQNFNNNVYYNQSMIPNQAAPWVNYDDQGLQGGNFQMAFYDSVYGAVPPHFGASGPIIPPQLPQHDASMDTMKWFNQPIPMEPLELLDLNDYPGRAEFLANYHAGSQVEVAQEERPATFQAASQVLPQPIQASLPVQAVTPSSTNVPAVTPHPNVTVELRDKDLWSAFYEKSNEMIMTIWGKEIFPRLSFKVNGLKCDGRYQWGIRLERTTPFLKKWDTKSKSWKLTQKEGQGPQESIELFSQINSGSAWMKGGVSFDKVKIYNVPGSEKMKKMTMEQKKDWEEKTIGKMELTSFCTYQPVLTLHEISYNGIGAMVATHRGEFRFAETEFIAVTEYRNDEIKKLKIVHTPYIDKTRKRKAQENNSEVKRRREDSGDDSGFSSQSSIASSSASTPSASPPPFDFQYYGRDGSAPSTSSH
ncbi:unnamed protein product [Caenorhabditis brenneri]